MLEEAAEKLEGVEGNGLVALGVVGAVAEGDRALGGREGDNSAARRPSASAASIWFSVTLMTLLSA